MHMKMQFDVMWIRSTYVIAEVRHQKDHNRGTADLPKASNGESLPPQSPEQNLSSINVSLSSDI